jgi:hypothetical protein
VCIAVGLGGLRASADAPARQGFPAGACISSSSTDAVAASSKRLRALEGESRGRQRSSLRDESAVGPVSRRDEETRAAAVLAVQAGCERCSPSYRGLANPRKIVVCAGDDAVRMTSMLSTVDGPH